MWTFVNILNSTAVHLFFKQTFHVCIVGSGPSAFYAAQYLLKRNDKVQVDMIEKLPAPFGLVRYGVAPDHPEVKNVINTFTQVAKDPRFQYRGNVTVGQDIRLWELRKYYDAILFAHGASVDRRMNIEGENLPGVVSARDVVAWYNGYPGLKFSPPDLDCDTVAIVGMGNVALDIARILLSPLDRLKIVRTIMKQIMDAKNPHLRDILLLEHNPASQTTDIPEPVMAHLSTSRVRRVVLVGRRGPLQSAFTLKEFREITRLPANRHGSKAEMPIDFTPPGIFDLALGTESDLEKLIGSLPRPRKRLVEFLLKTAQRDVKMNAAVGQCCEFRYLRSPLRVVPRDGTSTGSAVAPSRVSALELCVNRLEGCAGERQTSIPDEAAPRESLECGLVFRCIGYRSVRVDPDLPFDEAHGVVACSDDLGRVIAVADSVDGEGALLYAAGWARRGPVGAIVDTLVDAQRTASAILQDAKDSRFANNDDPRGFEAISGILQQRGVRPVTFDAWEKVDLAEKSAGQKRGKPREKITTIDDLLRVAFREVVNSRTSTIR